MSTEPLTDFEVKYPDPKERAAALTWLKFKQSQGFEFVEGAHVQYVDFSVVSNVGKSRLNALVMEDDDLLQLQVELKTLPRVPAIAGKGFNRGY